MVDNISNVKFYCYKRQFSEQKILYIITRIFRKEDIIMGYTTEQTSEEKRSSKNHSNPIAKKERSLKKEEFYSFLQELNCKTELGLE